MTNDRLPDWLINEINGMRAQEQEAYESAMRRYIEVIKFVIRANEYDPGNGQCLVINTPSAAAEIAALPKPMRRR